MKDLSLFLVKNSLGGKMRKGLRTFCNGDDSTSTLDQHNNNSSSSSYTHHVGTLEEMILKLDLEEEKARNTNNGRRMSCYNNSSSDILLSARNAAMSQYPRFSLDGKDAMYRSSFRNNSRSSTLMEEQGRRSVCCGELRRLRGRLSGGGGGLFLPPTLAGESVVWCKPGVVAKLMGLDAMPVPVKRRKQQHDDDDHRRHHRRGEIMDGRDEKEMMFKMRSYNKKTSGAGGGYCNVMKPVMEVQSGGGGGGRRFL